MRLGRHWRWAAAGLTVVVLITALVLEWREAGALRIEEPGRVDVRPPAAATSVQAATEEVAAALPFAPSASASRPDGAVEVCGLGWVTKPEDEAGAQALMSRLNLVEPRQRILAKLRADPGQFARATALLIVIMSSDAPGWLARVGLAPDDHADALDQLARMAVSSTDPRVYALAYKACGANRNVGHGACQLINADQWARLDPENAAPWLFILWSASERNDRSAQDEALHRIGSARRQSLGYFDTAGAVLDATPDSDGAQLAAWLLVREVIGVEAAVGIPGLIPLRKACTGEALSDANRLQTCSAIAETLIERSDTLLDHGIGRSIGRSVGWPAQRYERLMAESTAYSKAMMSEDSSADAYGCAKLRRDMSRMHDRAAIGEIASLLKWVDQSGKTHEDFVRENLARRAQMERAASGEAASASAAR